MIESGLLEIDDSGDAMPRNQDIRGPIVAMNELCRQRVGNRGSDKTAQGILRWGRHVVGAGIEPAVDLLRQRVGRGVQPGGAISLRIDRQRVVHLSQDAPAIRT